MSEIIAAPTHCTWEKRVLKFLRPAKTSYTVFEERPVWYLSLFNPTVAWRGVGECAPLEGLSLEGLADIEGMLETIRQNPSPFFDINHPDLRSFPSIKFALECALLQYYNRGSSILFKSDFSDKKRGIPINGLIWMGDFGYMMEQIKTKINQGSSCIKIKIGNLHFDDELTLLRRIRSTYSSIDLEIRLDANGAFNPENAYDRLCALSAFDIHSIEQPIKPGQLDAMAELCRTSPILVALDEELIRIVRDDSYSSIIKQIKPAYLILKPSLLGGFKQCEAVIAIAKKNNIGFWVTSALESNIALNYIAQWVATIAAPGTIQGLGTGQLFSNNAPSSLKIADGRLYFDEDR